MIESPGFEERVRCHVWTGSTDITLYEGRRACSHCSVGEIIRLGPFTQPALFVHGGYGAAAQQVIDVCLACGRVTVTQQDSINPRRLNVE